MFEFQEKMMQALTYGFSGFTVAMSYLDQHAAGIGAMATIVLLIATLWFKAQHLKIARQQQRAEES